MLRAARGVFLAQPVCFVAARQRRGGAASAEPLHPYISPGGRRAPGIAKDIIIIPARMKPAAIPGVLDLGHREGAEGSIGLSLGGRRGAATAQGRIFRSEVSRNRRGLAVCLRREPEIGVRGVYAEQVSLYRPETAGLSSLRPLQVHRSPERVRPAVHLPRPIQAHQGYRGRSEGAAINRTARLRVSAVLPIDGEHHRLFRPADHDPVTADSR